MILSLLYGGITHHYLGSNLPYCNRIGGNEFGTIHNEYIIGLVGDNKTKIGGIVGKDSACGSIFGPVATFNIEEDLDFVIGGYNTNYKEFHDLNIEPPSFNGITPIVGLDYRIPIYKSKNTTVSVDNVISIGIISHSLRVDF